MRAEAALDWRSPDYGPIYAARAERLTKLRADPAAMAWARKHYAENPADFITDWGMTLDPRDPAQPTLMPFVLFPRQRELVDELMDCYHKGESPLIEKSRDMGASWVAMALSCTLCLFRKGVAIGFGSRKEDQLDKVGDPSSLFSKGRDFMRYLPPEFRGEWDDRKHAAHMRLLFPWTGSSIVGEAGDNIGRGGRTSIFFVDEAAYLEHPKLADASLAANTNCRVDISSVNGTANSFAEKRHRAGTRVFTFHYRDDPRKDEAWKAKKQAELDPVVWAAEYEIDYRASVEGIVIPAAWVEASIDAHIRLGIEPTGKRVGALDIADTGADKNAYGITHGILLTHVESWRGSATLDTFHTVERAFALADENHVDEWLYDADGLGGPVRGDARKVNEARSAAGVKQQIVRPYRGSGAVFKPDTIVPGTERKAKDYFENLKAQAWHTLRERFKLTARVIAGEVTQYDRGAIISISSKLRELSQLKLELSQPTWVPSKTGKWMIEKAPEGTMSPNLADTVVIAYAPRVLPMNIHAGAIAALSVPANLRR